MDIRLVRTFFDAFIGIIVHRDKEKGLLLRYIWKDTALSITNTWCPRADKRLLNNKLPIYRFRLDLAHLLLFVLVHLSESGKT
jgi:hypothetical protein